MAILSPKVWAEVKALLEAALALPPSSRSAWLSQQKNFSPEVRAEVALLLQNEATSHDFLETPFSPPDAPFEPFRIGKYYVVQRLGSGGMAQVFRARVRGAGRFEKQVALKRLQPELVDDQGFRKLFEYEARISSRLNHPNIAQVHDFLIHEGAYYLEMEFVAGRNLALLQDRIRARQQKFPADLAALIVGEVAKGLEYAHTLRDPSTNRPLGLVHRDVAPKNIMISFDGNVKLVDFGVAKAHDRTHLTQAGGIVGTLQYMSPEQAAGDPIDRRSDIFSMGATLFELLVGEPLFPATNTMVLISSIRDGKRVERALETLDAPAPLVRILKRSLATDRDARYQSAGEMYADLQRFPGSSASLSFSKTLARLMHVLFAKEIEDDRSVSRKVEEVVVALETFRPVSTPARPPTAFASEPTPPTPGLSAPIQIFIALVGVAVVAFGVLFRGNLGPVPEREVAVAPTLNIPTFVPPPLSTRSEETEPLPAGVCAVRIESEPEGARITMNGIDVGATPFEVRVACEKPVSLTLQAPGYVAFRQSISVTRRKSRLKLTLTPDAAR